MEGGVNLMLSSRDAYKHELTKLAYKYEDIIAVEADLGGKKHIFKQHHPSRFFNFGIAEMASIDICSGLAQKGFKPYFSTFAPFLALRCAESLKLSLSYMEHNIKIIACYGGVSGGWFGTTHHCLEDMSIVATLPNITIACPHGEEEVRSVIRKSYFEDKPYYIRLYRNDTFESIKNPYNKPFVIDGEFDKNNKMTLISIGEISTEICKEINDKSNKINHIHLIYVDKDSLKTYINELSSLLKGHKIITVEEHRQTGSISNLLASLIDNTVIPFTPNDEYPHHGGSHAEVLNQLGFSKEKLLTLLKEVE